MKVIERAVMPNGTEIQLENWGKYGFYIVAYPVAKHTGKYNWIKKNESFRLTIKGNSALSDFEALKNGEKTLEELSSLFWNGEKDMWYLGMNVENRDY